MLKVVLSQTVLQSSGAAFQFPAQKFCSYQDGECVPRTTSNVPDDHILELILKSRVSSPIPSGSQFSTFSGDRALPKT